MQLKMCRRVQAQSLTEVKIILAGVRFQASFDKDLVLSSNILCFLHLRCSLYCCALKSHFV